MGRGSFNALQAEPAPHVGVRSRSWVREPHHGARASTRQRHSSGSAWINVLTSPRRPQRAGVAGALGRRWRRA